MLARGLLIWMAAALLIVAALFVVVQVGVKGPTCTGTSSRCVAGGCRWGRATWRPRCSWGGRSRCRPGRSSSCSGPRRSSGGMRARASAARWWRCGSWPASPRRWRRCSTTISGCGSRRRCAGSRLTSSSGSPDRSQRPRRAARRPPGERGRAPAHRQAHRRLGQWEYARAIYRQVLESEPDNVEALLALGSYYHLKGEFTSAGQYYQRATATEPPSAAAYYNLSLAHSEAYQFEEDRGRRWPRPGRSMTSRSPRGSTRLPRIGW